MEYSHPQREDVYVRRFLVIGLLLPLAGGCESEPHKQPAAAPIIYDSTKAPYHVELSPPWTLTSADSLNTHADLAATYKDQLYLIVIPQRLPTIPGVDTPNALALKRASVSVLEERLDGFKITRQGPIRVDSEIGQSVFAIGQTEGLQIQYVATYLTMSDWGFQIVGWGPADKTNVLTAEMDRILNSWRFTGQQPERSMPDTETEDAEDASIE